MSPAQPVRWRCPIVTIPELTATPAGADLLAAMQEEGRLLAELRGALVRQRQSVASGEPAVLDSASQAVSRLILTLDTARRRREQLAQHLTGGAALRFANAHGQGAPVEGLEGARQALRAEAGRTAAELADTQATLHAAIHAGDVYLQALFASVTVAEPAYGSAVSGPPATSRPVPGTLVDRSA